MQNPTPAQSHSSSLRTYRSYNNHGCWFVTKCITPRRPAITHTIATTIANAFHCYAQQGKITIAAFVVMPDHWHLLFHTAGTKTLEEFMQTACHWIGHKTNSALTEAGAIWQDGFHESRIKTARQFQYVRHYIEENPVRKNLALSPQDWMWSTAHEQHKTIVPLDWPFEFEKD